MTNNAIWLIIGVGLASAFVAWIVTRDYYVKKITLLLKGIAAEREAEQHEIMNARIINRIHDGLSLQQIKELGS